jgi:hypothetical protein
MQIVALRTDWNFRAIPRRVKVKKQGAQRQGQS